MSPAECRWDQRVGRGIPFVVIDSIEDADQTRTPVAKDRIEVGAEGRGLDFPRVGRRYRGQPVGRAETRGKKVEIRTLFETGRGEKFPGKADRRKATGWIDTLVAEIVDGQHACGLGEITP